jgi:hypothetical protein
MGRVALLLFVMGCGFSSPHGGDDDGPADAPSGGGPDGEDPLCAPWLSRGGHLKDPCDVPPKSSWQISGAGGTYNTDDGMFSDGTKPNSKLVTMPGPDSLQMRVVSVDSFVVAGGASLRVVGQYPLLVLSSSTIDVAGTIDVSSQRASGRGAGANLSGCQPPGDGVGIADAGGGGGGGYSVSGGDGGEGNAGNNNGGQNAGSIGRPKFVVRGGCPGGTGGTGAGAAAGGDGGGAIQLTAKATITISGTIHVGGMGGQGAVNAGTGGGGGGGSGGFIGLDAPRVTAGATSVLAANGGGGGAGCQTTSVGGSGLDGQLASAVATGGSGSGCSNGVSGGTGSALAMITAGNGTPGISGGGGAGGGIGYILVWTPSTADFMKQSGAVVTPAEQSITMREMQP